ncbi:hypothetical protein [Streptacidiphilus anmyonensis]|uniref:hypothetical protein n=1 Tax=Streptacidiphilus anmyonensis TaxID=405782 RepID=UPI000B2EEE66|nr:hypothetical protein [Streptacidiphilus anmyonensis]
MIPSEVTRRVLPALPFHQAATSVELFALLSPGGLPAAESWTTGSRLWKSSN